jgi:hypothetical protein
MMARNNNVNDVSGDACEAENKTQWLAGYLTTEIRQGRIVPE